MTHAWLFTGPPGLRPLERGRAFAAALQCERGGCGECLACRTALAGSHADVTRDPHPELSIGVDDDARAGAQRGAVPGRSAAGR